MRGRSRNCTYSGAGPERSELSETASSLSMMATVFASGFGTVLAATSSATRARALLQGRLAPSIDDVIALARPVLQHRMALSFAARADGRSLSALIETLCARIDKS